MNAHFPRNRNKRPTTNSILAGVILSALTSTYSNGASSSNITAVWANEGGDKVTQDELRATNNTENLTGNVINRAWNGNQIMLSGARNEVVSFNLVLEAGGPAATNVSVSFNSLQGAGAEMSISSVPTSGNGVFNWVNRPIELFYLRYLQIQGLSYFGYDTWDERQIPLRLQRPWTGAGVGTGTWTDRPDHDKFYPDIMVPLELVPAFNIAPGTNQSIWADIYIPKTAPPGIYTGTVTMQENGTPTRSVPVTLTVYGFTLPDVPSAKTMVALDTSDILWRYNSGYDIYANWQSPMGLQTDAITDKYFELFHRHKISLIGENDCPITDQPCATSMPRLNGSLFEAANGYDGPGVNTPNDIYSIGTYGGWSWKTEGEQAMWTHADNWANWFQQNLPNIDYFIYLEDEPPPSDYAQVNTWAQWIQEDPGPGHNLRSMSTTYGVFAQAYMPYLNIPDTAAGMGICPNNMSPCANTAINQASADFYRTTPGDKLWVYNGADPGAGTADTEEDGVAMRQLGWAQYKKQIDRWFYWYANPTAPNDWFTQTVTFGTVSYYDPILGQTGDDGTTNGTGLLVYPGTSVYPGQTSYNVVGPFASLRLKEWRRGIQDADYLTLAAKHDPAAVQSIVNGLVPQVLWEVNAPDPDYYTGGGISWSADPDQWEAARAALARIILSHVAPSRH
jgi:hypothetical protein